MSTILTSLHGKQAGIDKDGFLTSPLGIKVPALYVGASDAEVRVGDVSVTQATISSTGTAIGNSGLTVLTSTAAKAYVLTDPAAAGLRKATLANIVFDCGEDRDQRRRRRHRFRRAQSYRDVSWPRRRAPPAIDLDRDVGGDR